MLHTHGNPCQIQGGTRKIFRNKDLAAVCLFAGFRLWAGGSGPSPQASNLASKIGSLLPAKYRPIPSIVLQPCRERKSTFVGSPLVGISSLPGHFFAFHSPKKIFLEKGRLCTLAEGVEMRTLVFEGLTRRLARKTHK